MYYDTMSNSISSSYSYGDDYTYNNEPIEYDQSFSLNLDLEDNVEIVKEEEKKEEKEKKRLSHDEKHRIAELKKMYIFKNFIGFLEIYGQENFGCGYEVDWMKVHRIIVENDIFDFNTYLENILYDYDVDFDSEEFRDICYKYIEDHVIIGLPIWTLYKLSDHMTKMFLKEEEEKKIQEETKLFNSYKCLKCKYYDEHIMIIRKGEFFSPEAFKNRYNKTDDDIKYQMLNHESKCTYREKLVSELEDEFNSLETRRNLIKRKYVQSKFKSLNCPKNFFYKDTDEYRFRCNSYKFIPITNRCKCNFFEEDESHNTYEKFINKYYELFIPSEETDEED